ncbi:unnamed protein product [Cyclocybe aegerita]|uniref:Uncharacterized protein n=1 Tax=Cyclocybe aegerita TaxID=1973307 RepID=A0A8S0WXC3_CYCAE|nr:unnamed protein product [Cyclocybe aegerita]
MARPMQTSLNNILLHLDPQEFHVTSGPPTRTECFAPRRNRCMSIHPSPYVRALWIHTYVGPESSFCFFIPLNCSSMASTAPFATVTTSKSTLMHACLAQLSPELQTMDSIIHATPKAFSCRKPTLPIEILLLIREFVFPIVTTHLVQQSTAALESYERSLRNLLCPDCIAYNLDIYGPDIWQWEQFTGACACMEIEGPGSQRQSYRTSGYRQQGHRSHRTTHVKGGPNPKEFADTHHWLESHLSRQAALRVQQSQSHSRGHHEPHASSSASATALQATPRPAPSIDIWDVVSAVLREFGCEAIREREERPSRAGGAVPSDSSSRVGRGLFPLRRDLVQIVPLGHVGSECASEAAWRAEAVLHWATRDLGLESTEVFGAHKREMPTFARRLRRSAVAHSHQSRPFQALLHFVGSLLAACLSLPLTITTVALTILCFYSRPSSLRII